MGGHLFKSRLWRLIASVVLLLESFSFGAPEPVGNFVSYKVDGNFVLFTCAGTHKVRLLVCTPGIIRVDFDPRGTFDLPNTFTGQETDWPDGVWSGIYPGKADLATYMLKNDWPAVSFGHTDAGNHIKITTEELTIRIYKSPFRIHFYDATDTRLINKDDDAVGMRCNTGGSAPCEIYIQKTRQPDERFFGFGNGNRGFNDAFTNDYTGFYEGPNPQGWYYPGMETYAAPFFYSTRGYGIFAVFDASYAGKDVPRQSESKWDMGQSSPNYYSIRFWNYPTATYFHQYLSYYFINGPQWRKVIKGYTDISGRTPIFEKKFFGVHAVNRCFGPDYSARCIEDQINAYRNGRFPLDVYISEQREGAGTMDQWWGDMNNTAIPGYRWFPDPGTPYWNGAANPNPERLLQWVHEKGLKFGANATNGYDRPKDVEAVQYIVDRGFDVYWRDVMTYSFMHNDIALTFANFAKAFKDTARTWIRFGWAQWVGQQYGSHHVGDKNYSHAIKAILAISLGGYPFCQVDLALQGWRLPSYALMPVPFFHVSGTKEETQPWLHDQLTQELYREWMRFHQRMVPYLYTYACRAHFDGMPVWRHMICEHPTNKAAWNKDYQTYVGDWLLMAPPYLETMMSVNVWLPEGKWIDFFTGTKHEGEKTISYSVAGYRLPLFVKAGAIIPMAPAMDYIGQIPEDPITVRVWPAGSTQFEVWEDHQGVKTQYRCDHYPGILTRVSVGPFNGSLYSPATRRYIFEVFTDAVAPQKVVNAADESELPKLADKAAFEAADRGWFYDPARGGVCFVKPGVEAKLGCAIVVSYNGQIGVKGAFGNNRAVGMPRISLIGDVLTITSTAPYEWELTDACGRIIRRGSSKGGASVWRCALRGVCLLRINAGGRSETRTIGTGH